jgi:photosystem II stability/assembly factor-like uncharacterized protein
VLAGTDIGVYRWDPSAERWNYVPSPMDGMHILQIGQHPHDANLIVAGTRPAAIFISEDGGATWYKAPVGNASKCEFINTPRVTSIQFDPVDRDTLWATIEIDAIWRSRDRGRTWQRLADGLRTDDTHNLVIFDTLGKRRILCSTELGLHRSDDDGETWNFVDVPQAPWSYFRCMARRPDSSGVMFLSVGDRPSGETGLLLRSRDWGETWEDACLPTPVNSTIWLIGTNPANPRLIFCCTIMGQMFRSTDGGEVWTKIKRELGELRMITWAPAPPD